MGDWSCIKCGQPMLPAGEVKRPNEYDHASGCPFDESQSPPTLQERADEWVDARFGDVSHAHDRASLAAEFEAVAAEARAKALREGAAYLESEGRRSAVNSDAICASRGAELLRRLAERREP